MTDEEMAGGLTDEQMAGPEEGGPESFLHPDKFKPSAGHRRLKNTGSIEQVRRDLNPAQAADAPLDERLTASIYDLFDKASFGGLRAALSGADTLPGIRQLREQEGDTGPEVSRRIVGAIDRYRGEHPTASNYTGLPAYFAPQSGPSLIAQGVENAIPQVVNPVAQAARAALGGAATSGLISGTEAAMRGDEPMEVLREGGRGAAGGLAIGAPVSAAAALLGAGSRAVLRSKGAKAREYLESRGQPLTAADTSDAAIGAAAQRTDQAVKERMGAFRGEVATGPYREALDAVPQHLADQAVDVTPIYRDLKLAANDPANLQVSDKLNTLVNMLGDRPVMTQQELNGLRRSLAGISGIGETNAAKMAPLRRAYESAKALVDRGPYAEANRLYTEGIGNVDESLGMVGLRRTNNPDEPIAGNLRVASQRQGQNTVTAGADTERLDIEAFKAKHPELANVIDAPEIIRNQGDISFHAGGPSHGGLIDRVVGHLPMPAVIAAAALGHGWKGAAAAAAAMAYANRNAITGRVLYNPALNSQLAAQALLQGVPAMSAPGREVIQEGR